MADLSLRYISTLENQLVSKDDQLRRLDARLQDSFEMQRALALLVKEYEKRTGISSDLMWSALPEDELEENKENGETVLKKEESVKDPVAEIDQEIDQEKDENEEKVDDQLQEPKVITISNEDQDKPFSEWLRS